MEESAFEGVTSMTIVDAGNCQTIGKWAFKDTGLTKIKLPIDCEINDATFYGLDQVYVFAPKGGSTEAFCNAPDHDNLIFIETN